MRRITLVVAVLAMLVVMVGSAVPALAQMRGERGDDPGNNYDRSYDHNRGDYDNYYNPGYGYAPYANDYYNYYNYYPSYGYAPYANDYYGNGSLFGPCGLFGTYNPY